MSKTGTQADVVTAEVIRNGMTAAALEMARTFRRTAYNPLLWETQDYGLGVVSPAGELWGEAPGVAVFVGALADTVKSGIEDIGVENVREGDVVIVNDPFVTGTHIVDTTLYLPVFHAGELVAFTVGTAHWADIGGMTPGGWCPDSQETYQEGLCLQHLKLVDAGVRNEALWKLIRTNVRFADIVMGDLEATIAACRQGALRVVDLCERYGAEAVLSGMALVIERTDAAVRRQIAELPDGSYSADTMLDGDGVQQDVPFPVALQLTVSGDRVKVAFEGTSESRGGPVNLPAVGTMSAVRCALKGLTLPTDPTNEGHFLAIDFDLTPGTAVTPERPAPTDSYGYLVVAICELTVRALATAVPERCPAGGSQFAIVFLYRSDPRQGAPFIMVDPVDAGSGGRPFEDAPTLGVLGNGDVPNTPVEVLETRYPVICERAELTSDVAGPGTFRGGFGSRRDYRVLEDGTLVNVGLENARHPLGRGLDGGEDGGAARVVITRAGTRTEEVIQDKVAGWGPLAAGDVVSMRSAGGAGWQSPRRRDPEAVARDVRDGWITVDEAADVYGVAVREVDGRWQVDAPATERLRASAGTA